MNYSEKAYGCSALPFPKGSLSFCAMFDKYLEEVFRLFLIILRCLRR
ncbi:MAG: hypothetical protein HWQ23_30130 [Nostoc sp. JL33]|nr:hypothetical protein [Nostoc sp. JL33]MBN3874373.1 hypothetical protein [Nostoc sp. JL33]